MRLLTLTARGRRVLAIGLLACVLLLAYLVMLHWWFVAPLSQVRSEMDALRAAQSQYAAALAEAPALRARIQALDAQQASNTAFWGNEDASTAVAALMQHVTDTVAAQAAGGSCTVNQKLMLRDPPRQSGEPYRRAAVNIKLSCDMQALVGVLHALEDGSPYAFIDDLSIYRNPVAARQGKGRPLEVQFTLSGYLRPAHADGPGALAATRPGA